jgi:hypothetical protein
MSFQYSLCLSMFLISLQGSMRKHVVNNYIMKVPSYVHINVVIHFVSHFVLSSIVAALLAFSVFSWRRRQEKRFTLKIFEASIMRLK